MNRVKLTLRLPVELSLRLQGICKRHGDQTFFIEEALTAYLDNYAPFNPPTVKKKAPAKRFVKPGIPELQQYFMDSGSKTCIDDAQHFIDFYDSKGWKVGKNPMKNWKAAVNNWMRGKTNGDDRQSIANGKTKRTAASAKVSADLNTLRGLAEQPHSQGGGVLVDDGQGLRECLEYDNGANAN